MMIHPETLSQRVQHTKVLEGKLKSEYDRPPEPYTSPWRPASELATQTAIRNGKFEPKYTTYIEMIDDMFSKLTDFKLEAWRTRKTLGSPNIGLRMIDLVYESSGSAPVEVPIWGPGKLDLTKVFRLNELTRDQILPQFHYRKAPETPWMRNARKDKHKTHTWIARPESAPIPVGMTTELHELVQIEGYPFYLYRPGKWDKPAGTDPYRMQLNVAIGDHLEPERFWLAMGVMYARGIIDPRDVADFIRAQEKNQRRR